jgi:hypothetical protein
MNVDTGVRYTLTELKEIWERFGSELKHETFEDMLNSMKKLDVVYRLIDLDTKHDDEHGNTFETKEEAIAAFNRAIDNHRVQGDTGSVIELAVYEYGREDGEDLIDIDYTDANRGDCIINCFDPC